MADKRRKSESHKAAISAAHSAMWEARRGGPKVVDGEKHCSSCEVFRPFSEYHKNKSGIAGLDATCKSCVKARRAEHYRNNREAILARNREWDRLNPDARKQAKSRWVERNPERVREAGLAHHRRRSSDIQYRVNAALRSGIHRTIRGNKGAKTFEFLGFDWQTFKTHLERQFSRGMTWENYGEWEIDHIVPLSSFGGNVAAAWALTNLRPLWRSENRSKKDARIFLV